MTILRELVRRNLLPNRFRQSSQALALVNEVRAATEATTWNSIAAVTDLAVLHVLLEIARQCCKAEFSAAVREIGERARLNAATVSRSLRRLVKAGWLTQIAPARGARAATWCLRIPSKADRDATILHAGKAGDCVSQIDPCFTQGGRADLFRSPPFFDHDLFRWGRGLGLAKARIYSLLAVPMSACKIAHALRYKHRRNVTLHLRKLAREGLVRRLDDGRYERTEVDLDTVAERRGMRGARDRQRARHRVERANWRRWSGAFEHWRQTGEVVDPETGEILENQGMPNKRAKMHLFRQCVLLNRGLTGPRLDAERAARADGKCGGAM